jgi:four helix bundle protein
MENGQQPVASTNRSIRNFTDLETWQLARTLRREIYQLYKGFPKDEKFGLMSQIRRAAISITANIAEGYGCFSYQENVQFCRLSRASTYEVRDHLMTALDQGYVLDSEFQRLNEMAISVIRLLNGYIRATTKRKGGSRQSVSGA